MSTLSSGSAFYPAVQAPVPQQVSTEVSSGNIQATSLPVATLQTSTTQEHPKPPSSSVDNTTSKISTEVNQSNQTVGSSTIATTSPFTTEAVSGYNLSMPGGYVMPTQAIPYAVQCAPTMQQPG